LRDVVTIMRPLIIGSMYENRGQMYFFPCHPRECTLSPLLYITLVLSGLMKVRSIGICIARALRYEDCYHPLWFTSKCPGFRSDPHRLHPIVKFMKGMDFELPAIF